MEAGDCVDGAGIGVTLVGDGIIALLGVTASLKKFDATTGVETCVGVESWPWT